MFSRLLLAPDHLGVGILRQPLRPAARSGRDRAARCARSRCRRSCACGARPRGRSRPCRCTARRAAPWRPSTSWSVSHEDAAERRARAHVGQRRDALLVAQQRLRRHHDQRLAEVAAHLAAQRVEIVGRRGRHDHLPVVLGGELQVALEPRRAVLRPLPLVAVRQQHHQAVHAQPLALARADELVDDDLRAVGEVAELRFPQHQRIGLGRGVAVLEAQHARLGQRAVDHLEAAPGLGDVIERDVLAPRSSGRSAPNGAGGRCRGRNPGR